MINHLSMGCWLFYLILLNVYGIVMAWGNVEERVEPLVNMAPDNETCTVKYIWKNVTKMQPSITQTEEERCCEGYVNISGVCRREQYETEVNSSLPVNAETSAGNTPNGTIHFSVIIILVLLLFAMVTSGATVIIIRIRKRTIQKRSDIFRIIDHPNEVDESGEAIYQNVDLPISCKEDPPGGHEGLYVNVYLDHPKDVVAKPDRSTGKALSHLETTAARANNRRAGTVIPPRLCHTVNTYCSDMDDLRPRFTDGWKSSQGKLSLAGSDSSAVKKHSVHSIGAKAEDSSLTHEENKMAPPQEQEVTKAPIHLTVHSAVEESVMDHECDEVGDYIDMTSPDHINPYCNQVFPFSRNDTSSALLSAQAGNIEDPIYLNSGHQDSYLVMSNPYYIPDMTMGDYTYVNVKIEDGNVTSDFT